MDRLILSFKSCTRYCDQKQFASLLHGDYNAGTVGLQRKGTNLKFIVVALILNICVLFFILKCDEPGF